MSQNIEIEIKNMLTKAEYERLLLGFSIDKKQIFSQENFYFDTPNFSLKKAKSALRIRRKDTGYEMTLKQPAPVGLLETNQKLTNDEASEALNLGKLPDGQIQKLIEECGIPYKEIVFFGSLVTNRVEVEFENGLLVLDHSSYLNTEDYELEYEVNNYQAGMKAFQVLLAHFMIPERKAENKVKRFYNQKYQQQKQK